MTSGPNQWTLAALQSSNGLREFSALAMGIAYRVYAERDDKPADNLTTALVVFATWFLDLPGASTRVYQGPWAQQEGPR